MNKIRAASCITPEEAAETLGIGVRFFYSLLASGRIESLKLGRRRLIPTEALDRFVAELNGNDSSTRRQDDKHSERRHRGKRQEARGCAHQVADTHPKGGSAARIIELAELAVTELWHTPDGEPYLTTKVGGCSRHMALQGREASLWLRRLCFRVKSKWVPDPGALTTALQVLQSEAIFSGDEHPVHVRVAGGDGGRIYLDLADKEGRAVEVTASGWKVITNPP